MASIELIKASDGTGNAEVPTVQTTRAPGATTIDVDTVQGINVAGFAGSMGTPHTFVDPITAETITVISEATCVDFFGHVDGSNLEIDTIAPGQTDLGSAAGDIIIIRPTTQWSDNVAETLEVVHEDDGTLKSGAADRALNAPQGFLINGQIERTVASNNLTVAIKTLAGTNPSTTDPVYVRIGNTIRSITAALSVTKNAGTNWFGSGNTTIATTEMDYFVYLCWNTTDSAVTISFSRIPSGRTYADFSTTSTVKNYWAGSGSAPASTDEVENIGRFGAILSATASFNWSLPGTSVVVSRPTYETRTFSFTNAGSAGGTFYWKQVGSVMRIWGQTASISTSTSTASKALTIPTSLLLTAQSAFGAPDAVTTTQQQIYSGNSFSTTAVNFYVSCQAGTGTATVSLEVIGT